LHTHAVTVLALNEQFIIHCQSNSAYRITILPEGHGDSAEIESIDWLSDLVVHSVAANEFVYCFLCLDIHGDPPLSELPVLPSSFHLHVISVAKHNTYRQLKASLKYNMCLYGVLQISLRSPLCVFFLQLFSVKRCNSRIETRHYENYLRLAYS